MSEKERANHDEAWELDFGDYDKVLLAAQEEKPENLLEHPMSKNMGDKMREFVAENPQEIVYKDENGLTLLHTETIVEILLELGADKTDKSNANKTALEYAKLMKWEHLEVILS